MKTKMHSDVFSADVSEQALLFKLLCFVHDLTTYSNNSASQRRLDQSTDTFYMSSVYFTPEEKETLLNKQITVSTVPGSSTVPETKTAEQLLQERFDNISTADHAMCTSHTIAPIFHDIFGIKKTYQADKKFIKQYKLFDKANR
jgi:hypothetical protein